MCDAYPGATIVVMTAPRERRTGPAQSPATWDILLTSALTTVLIGASFLCSLSAAMIGDSCLNSCNGAVLGAAHLVYWGGFAAAVVVAVVGMGRAAAADYALVVGPILGWAVFAGAWFVGGLLTEAAGTR